jgi:plastocyanin
VARKTVFKRLIALMGIAWGMQVLPSAADPITVTVTDPEGVPLRDVVVFVEQPGHEMRAAPGTSAVMDQVDERFVPHVLVVQTGTQVEFPNSDTVAHHVYSFSHPNHFKLPMYKGDAHPPVKLDESGIVVLGCNIHDNMLAYIVVVDTPVFAMTAEDGTAQLDAPADGRVSIWSPRIRDDAGQLTVAVDEAAADGAIEFRLEQAPRPPHRDGTEALSWSEY